MKLKLLHSAVILALGASAQAYAYDCTGVEQWSASQVYLSGDTVQKEGIAYQTSQWTSHTDPARSTGPWDAWQKVGNCGAATTPAKPATPGDPTGPVTEVKVPVAPAVDLAVGTTSKLLSEGDTLILSANATDSDGFIARVDFYANNQLIGSDNSTPFGLHWTATAGNQTFHAIAIDSDNLSTHSAEIKLSVAAAVTTPVTNGGAGCKGLPTYQAGTSYANEALVQVDNHKYRCDIGAWCSSKADWAYAPGHGAHWTDAWTDLGVCSLPPVISLDAGNLSTVLAGSTVTLSTHAVDSDGSVVQVEFFNGDTSLGVVTQAPYQLEWLATTVGSNTIRVLATDNEGSTGEATASITVSDKDLVATLITPNTGKTIGLGKALTLQADALSLTSEVKAVNFVVNGTVVATDSTAPYSFSWQPTAIANYTVAAQALDLAGNQATSTAINVKVVDKPAKKHKLVGYWHNFRNGAGCPMRLAEMSEAWDIIDIAFADNDPKSDGTVHFNLYAGDMHSSCPALDPVQFKQDMAALQAKGKIFVLSLGGAEGTITLNTDTDEVNFVNSLTALINEWGFDGLDVDLESGSNLMHGTQIQKRLGRALNQIETNIGGDMYLTMAPEHPYVHGGMIAMSGIWGAYIPVINETRHTLDMLHVQLYNNGGLPNPYEPGSANEGTVNMMVAQSKMLLEGFELADGTFFEPLRDDQVAIGLPSGPSSANSGQAPTQNILDALDCLTLGTKCGSIKPLATYPNYGGVMTWSVNWDEHDGYNFSGPVGQKLTEMNNR